MFDNIQPKNAGNVPPNLPIGEPEDIFGGNDDAPTPPDMPRAAAPEQPSPVASSALGAGVLRPKQPGPEPSPVSPKPPPPSRPIGMAEPPQGSGDMYRIKEPSIGKGIMVMIVTAVTVVVIGGGGWWLYQRFIQGAPEEEIAEVREPLPQEEAPLPSVPTQEEAPSAEEISPPTPSESPAIDDRIVDDQVLFGNPVDSDSDGIDDVRERQLATDPRNWDTDGDSLSDGDEVLGWKTDPLNSDTDGDSYADGQEVKNGYNPNGPGKFIQPPTSTPG